MSDLENENVQLKIQVKSLNAKIASMLEIAHNLRYSVTCVSSYAKLLQKDSSNPEALHAALDFIESDSAQAVRLIESLQRCGYET